MFSRRELFYIGVTLCILFIALFAIEYYAEVPVLTLNKSHAQINSTPQDNFYNVPYGLEAKRYKNIVDYLENAEELVKKIEKNSWAKVHDLAFQYLLVCQPFVQHRF